MSSRSFPAAVESLVDTLRDDGMPSARNLLVTVFGDAIAPHGRSVAVSVRSLASLLEPLGVTERLVRTSLSRLVADEILLVTRLGRRSFYGVHPDAVTLFDHAEQRIYHHADRDWDGWWTLVVIDSGAATPERRAALRRELEWLGLGSVAPNVLASPVVPVDDIVDAVRHVGDVGSVLVTRSQSVAAPVALTDAELAARCAPLGELGEHYEAVRRWFGPLAAAVDGEVLDPQSCFTARTLLIATFRRVVLSDPLLPTSLLPGSWVGHEAYDDVGSLYRTLRGPAEQWLGATVETVDGSLDEPVEDDRFAAR